MHVQGFCPKVSIIGAGNIGGTAAHLLSLRGLFEVALIDINADLARGKALDISQSSSIEGFDPAIVAGSDYSLLQGSAAVIVTAGLPRKPGMSRDELISTNAKIIDSVAKGVSQYCPEAFVVVITNPLDAMVYRFAKVSGLSTQRVVGMAGVLDASRFSYFLSQSLGVSVRDISSFVLGGHGDTMVPLRDLTSVKGISLSEVIKMGMLSEEDFQSIVQRTRDGGAEIVSLLKTGSAFYAPASSAISMVMAYLGNQSRLLPCAAMLNGEYGVENLYIGVPCLIDSTGVKKVLEVGLNSDESAMFKKSVEAVEGLVAALPA